jgi:prepilin-type N-terminal cleavage/methylation domain-containing protein
MSKTMRTTRAAQQGFTLVEMLIAVVVVLVGLVAVAQLVPTSVLMNANNRNDGTATVFAQQMMEALREQPLANTTFSDPAGVTCYPALSLCNLGDPTQPRVLVGSPVTVNPANLAIIDFSAGPVAGYSFTYVDPNDPYGATYDVRWAVITMTNAQVVTGKRFIVGVFRRNVNTTTVPITIDSMVEK